MTGSLPRARNLVSGPWGWIPVLSVLSGVSILLLSLANTLARAGSSLAEPVYWIALPLAIVLDVPERLCLLRNASRPERKVDPYLVRAQRSHLRRTIGGLDREGFRRVFILRTQEEVDEADVEREPVDRRL